MDQDITNTPRSNARRNERDGRTLDTPERRRIPQGPQLDLPPQPFPLAAAALPVGPIQSNDPFQNNYAPAPAPATAPAPAPVYHYLPAHLAQAAANLPPLQPVIEVEVEEVVLHQLLALFFTIFLLMWHRLQLSCLLCNLLIEVEGVIIYRMTTGHLFNFNLLFHL